MALTRRDLLLLSASFGLSPLGLRLVEGAQPPMAPDSLQTVLAGEIWASKLDTDPALAGRVLSTLGAIYRVAAGAKSPAEKQAAETEIARLISVGGPLDHKFVEDISSLLTAPTSSPDDAVYEALRFGSDIGGTLVGVVNPAVGAAINIGGRLAEPVLRTIPGFPGSPGFSVPVGNGAALTAIERLALTKAVELLQHSSGPTDILIDPAVLRAAGMPPTASVAELKTMLPAQTRALLESISEDTSHTRGAVAAILRRMSTAESTLAELQKAVEEARDARIAAERHAAAAQQMAYLDGEIRGAMQLGYFVIAYLFRDRSGARMFAAVSGAAYSVYSVGTAYTLGQVGAAAVVGGYVGAAVALLAIAVEPESDGVLLVIDRLGQQVEQLRQEMHERFNRLEMQFRAVADLLQTLAIEARRNWDGTLTLLSQLKRTTEQFEARVMAQERARSRSGFDEEVNVTRVLLAQERTESNLTELFVRLAQFYTHSMSVATQPAFAGVSTSDLASVRDQLTQRADYELSFVALSYLLGRLGRRSPADATANPREWARGAFAFVELGCLLPINSELPHQATQILESGLLLRDAVLGATHPDTVTDATHEYIRHARSDDTGTLRVAVSSLLTTWASTYLFNVWRKPDVREKSAILYVLQSKGLIRLEVPEGIVNDPFERALEKGLLSKQLVDTGMRSQTGLGGESLTWQRYKIKVESGQGKGRWLSEETLVEERAINGVFVPEGAVSRRWGTSGECEWLLDQSLKLVREAESIQVRQALPKWLADQLTTARADPQSPCVAFEVAALTTATVAAMALSVQSRNSGAYGSSLRNVPLYGDCDQIAAILGNYVRDALADEIDISAVRQPMPWSDEILGELERAMCEDARAIVRAMESPSGASLAYLDAALFAVVTFMKSHNLPTPEKPLAPEPGKDWKELKDTLEPLWDKVTAEKKSSIEASIRRLLALPESQRDGSEANAILSDVVEALRTVDGIGESRAAEMLMFVMARVDPQFEATMSSSQVAPSLRPFSSFDVQRALDGAIAAIRDARLSDADLAGTFLAPAVVGGSTELSLSINNLEAVEAARLKAICQGALYVCLGTLDRSKRLPFVEDSSVPLDRRSGDYSKVAVAMSTNRQSPSDTKKMHIRCNLSTARGFVSDRWSLTLAISRQAQ